MGQQQGLQRYGGGVPTLIDWLNAILAEVPGAFDPSWVNLEAHPFNVLLPGDVRSPKDPIEGFPPPFVDGRLGRRRELPLSLRLTPPAQRG